MLFNTFQFALFLGAVLCIYYSCPRRWRNSVLLFASMVFYFMWIPAYLLLLLLDLAVNYLLLRLMVRSSCPKRYLAASVVVSLGVLAYFKYAAFLLSLLIPLLEPVLAAEVGIPEILLPLGISFFTFQMLALTIDTFRGQIEPLRSFREYCLFISFFPQLIAGPILRGWQFLPQLRRGGQPNPERTRRAIWLIGCGVVKKVVLADALLAPFVDRVFNSPGFASAPAHLIAVYSFAFQIYFDFSGYTDIARGVGLLLGFELPLNFMEPYLSRHPAEFWRRWHITLSRWLRDYLYIPLGGNRTGPRRTYVNLMLTMLLGGLWHGAGWNFVIWGGLHGFFLALHRYFSRTPADAEQPLRWRDLPRITALFHAVCFLWIFFRAATFDDAVAVITRLLTGSYLEMWPVLQVAIVFSCFGLHGIERAARLHLPRLRLRLGDVWGGAIEGTVLGVVVALAVLLGGSGGEFIYFQF